MTDERSWMHVTVVDEKTDEEFAWVAADIRHAYAPQPVLVAGMAAPRPKVCVTLTEAQARTLAKRILSTLDGTDEDGEALT